MQIEVHIQLVRNNQMNLAYMICAAMFGNGLKHLLILIPSMSIQKVIVLSYVVAVGGMRKRTVVCPEDMPPTIPKKQVDWG